MSAIQNIQVGDTVPIELLIGDGAENQFPQAFVYDQGSTLISTVDLAHDHKGNYSGITYVMPNTEFIKVVYVVYSDSGHATLNGDYERDIEVFYRILPDEFKANVSLLALETTSQTILADTDNLQTNQGNWLTAVGFSVPNEYNAVLATIQADLDNPTQYQATGFGLAGEYDARMTAIQADLDDTAQYQATGFGLAGEYDARMTAIQADLDDTAQYKATGFGAAGEYDARMTAIQADLDDTAQYKATGFGPAGEYDARMTAIQLDLDTPDQYKATGFSVPTEYDARLTAIQLDLDTPDQYKATGFGLAGEYDASLISIQASLARILGLTQENQFIDTTVYAGDNLLSARLRLYSDAVSVGTDLNVTDTYTIAASYTGAGMQTYSMVKV